MRYCYILTALILCGLFQQDRASGAIVLTPVQTSPTSSPNVTVDLYATWDGNLSPGLDALKSNDVAAYRFRLQISGTVSGLSAAYATGSSWSNIAKVGGSSPAVNAGTQQITFEGANTQSPPSSLSPINNIDVGQTMNASTLLGTFSFSANSGTYVVNFTMLNSTVYPTLSGFSFVASNATTPGNQVSHTMSAPPANLLIAVVPEPSALATCSLVGLAWAARRRFRRGTAAQPAKDQPSKA